MAVEKIGVIGAGQMGTGISHVLALAGYDVILDDVNKDALSKALDDEGVRKRLLDLGSDIPGPDRRGQAALNKLVEGEIARWTPVIKESGVTQ